MLMGDFISLIQFALPVKVIVYYNCSLGFVAMEMKTGGYLDTGTDLKNPNFAAMAEAMGVLAARRRSGRSRRRCARLSLIGARRSSMCGWRHNRSTRGASLPVLSY